MLSDHLLHPDHVIPPAKLIDAPMELADCLKSHMSVKLFTIFRKKDPPPGQSDLFTVTAPGCRFPVLLIPAFGIPECYGNRKFGSDALFGLNGDVAVHHFHDAFCDGHSQPGASVPPAPLQLSS